MTLLLSVEVGREQGQDGVGLSTALLALARACALNRFI